MQNEAGDPPESGSDKGHKKGRKGNKKIAILFGCGEGSSQDCATRPIRPNARINVVAHGCFGHVTLVC